MVFYGEMERDGKPHQLKICIMITNVKPFFLSNVFFCSRIGDLTEDTNEINLCLDITRVLQTGGFLVISI